MAVGWEGFAPLSLGGLFKGQLYTLNTIMKYKQGKFKNTFLLKRDETDKLPEPHLIVAFSSQPISYSQTMSYSSTGSPSLAATTRSVIGPGNARSITC